MQTVKPRARKLPTGWWLVTHPVRPRGVMTTFPHSAGVYLVRLALLQQVTR